MVDCGGGGILVVCWFVLGGSFHKDSFISSNEENKDSKCCD